MLVPGLVDAVVDALLPHALAATIVEPSAYRIIFSISHLNSSFFFRIRLDFTQIRLQIRPSIKNWVDIKVNIIDILILYSNYRKCKFERHLNS